MEQATSQTLVMFYFLMASLFTAPDDTFISPQELGGYSSLGQISFPSLYGLLGTDYDTSLHNQRKWSFELFGELPRVRHFEVADPLS